MTDLQARLLGILALCWPSYRTTLELERQTGVPYQALWRALDSLESHRAVVRFKHPAGRTVAWAARRATPTT